MDDSAVPDGFLRGKEWAWNSVIGFRLEWQCEPGELTAGCERVVFYRTR